MPDLRPLLLIFIASSVWATSAAAQVTDARWYRVELLIFAQPTGTASEQWPASPTLVYPGNWRFLQSMSADATVKYDSQGRQIVDERNAALPEPLKPMDARAGDGGVIALPDNYSLLPGKDQEFRGKAAYMQRSGGYRILFHEHWLQAFVEGSKPPAIIIDRPAGAGPWPELQGTVQLSLSRFLHLETNLWLNTDGSYLDGAWQMPAPPQSPSAILVFKDEAGQSDYQQTIAAAGAATPGSDAQLATLSTAVDPSAPALEPQYPYRHAVLMAQKRRMRSNEIHYMDHPMLGVVAKITPLDAEELEAYASARTPGS